MQPTDQCFPRELLTQSIEERLAYFERIIVAHPRLVEVRDALIQILESPNRPLVIGVVGPTGVGKSAMRTLIEKYILEGALRELERNPGCIPVAGMLTIAPEYGAFCRRQIHFGR